MGYALKFKILWIIYVSMFFIVVRHFRNKKIEELYIKNMFIKDVLIIK